MFAQIGVFLVDAVALALLLAARTSGLATARGRLVAIIGARRQAHTAPWRRGRDGARVGELVRVTNLDGDPTLWRVSEPVFLDPKGDRLNV